MDEYLYTCDTAHHALVAVVVVGLPLVLALLYKIHVDHQHKQKKEQAYREIMEAYERARSSQATDLQREVVATRMKSDTQKMELEASKKTLRQQHMQEIGKLEAKHRECERKLQANEDKIDRLKQDHLEKEEKSQRRLKELEEELQTLRSEKEKSESWLKEQRQISVQEQVKAYEQLSDEFTAERTRRDAVETALRDEKKQLEDNLLAKHLENEELQRNLKKKEDEHLQKMKQLQEELRRMKEEEKKRLISIPRPRLHWNSRQDVPEVEDNPSSSSSVSRHPVNTGESVATNTGTQ